MRADAATNRARMLDAAEEIMRITAAMPSPDAIRQHANVGRTTYFRHFPDQAVLMAALLDRAVEQLAQVIEEMRGDDDGLFKLIDLIAAGVSNNLGFVAFWFDDPKHGEHIDEVFDERMRQVAFMLEAPINRAKLAQFCRADITPADIILAIPMLAGSMRGRLPIDRAAAASRAVELLTSGIAAR